MLFILYMLYKKLFFPLEEIQVHCVYLFSRTISKYLVSWLILNESQSWREAGQRAVFLWRLTGCLGMGRAEKEWKKNIKSQST